MDEQETDDRGVRIAKRASALLAQRLGDPEFTLNREEMIQAIDRAIQEDEVLYGRDE